MLKEKEIINNLPIHLKICFLFTLISKVKFSDMRLSLFLFSGLFAGLYLSWPGLVIPNNWKCFKDIISKSAEDKISLKAVMEVSPSYLLKGRIRNKSSRIRILADACFR